MIFRSPISLLLVVFMACGCSHDSPSVPTATENRETGESTDSDGHPAGSETATPPPGMVWIEGGEFTMGSEDEMSRFNERPVHQVEVTRFWIDVTPVTNAQFQKFVDATGYVTIAERKPDWEELRKLPRCPGGLGRCGRLREVGRQAAAHRSGMGICSTRTESRSLPLGR